MSPKAVNISFDSRILSEIDRVAREESRSRSELIREAARAYLDRRQRWGDIFRYGEKTVQSRGLVLRDVGSEIRKWRKRKVK